METLEDYTLLFNPDGDALLMIDALPGEPDNPALILKDGKAVLQRGPSDEFEITGLGARQIEKLVLFDELEVMEQVEPELGENPKDQKSYTLKLFLVEE